jgi:hypothetical protein
VVCFGFGNFSMLPSFKLIAASAALANGVSILIYLANLNHLVCHLAWENWYQELATLNLMVLGYWPLELLLL